MSGVARQNIEIKVRLSAAGPQLVQERLDGFVAAVGHPSVDVDTYFQVPYGRLKLRVSGDQPSGTLISYARPNEAMSRLSHYRLVEIADAQTLREALSTTLGVLVTVTKRRTVYIYGSTRIHLDQVEDLGWFVELETVIGTQSHAAALAEHRDVFDSLRLENGVIVPESYSDLLLKMPHIPTP